MMRNKVGRDFKCTRNVSGQIARVLLGVLSWAVLLSVGAAFSTQGKKAEAKLPQAPAIKNHEPFAGKACIDCHKQVTSSKVRCLLAKGEMCALCHAIPVDGGPARMVDTSESVCFKCHEKKGFKGSFSHGPFAVAACITCHDPHGGNAPGMLRIPVPQLCLGCHTDLRVRFTNAQFRHTPAITQCLDCHSPHVSDQRYLLKIKAPELCGKCHEKVVKDYQTALVKHSPVAEDSACMNCHDPHMAEERSLLLADGCDICLKCHDKTVKSGQQDLADMKLLLASNPKHHGPIQDRNCSGCHNPHSSSNLRLLTDEYPKGFYAPYFASRYALCFRCHDSGLAKEEHTATLTEFRDGDRNLHFLHVNRTSNGRTCRSCHVVHASVSPKYIGQTVPFGSWQLPIKFVKTDTGGGCEPGCHEAQKYDRKLVKKQQR
jgi:predicted CXXCH cytochrome family protein